MCAIFFTFISVSANAALSSRLGGDAAWDDQLGITWLTNASLSGANSWANQLSWIDDLNTANHLGFNDWRLASSSVTAGVPDAGFQTSIVSCTTNIVCPTNELGHMFYYNLGGNLGNVLTGTQAVDDVTLTGIQTLYWSGTEFNSLNAWTFFFSFGDQYNSGKLAENYGWAVRAGDVGAVPVPAAVWLFGSGLLGLVGVARRKKA